jgi:uncharacterized surface protein with fasciclin (FAS1) repeats
LAVFLEGCGGGGGGSKGSNGIAAFVAQRKDLTLLVRALRGAGLADSLSGKDAYTVFAPSNEAFYAMPPAQLAYMLNSKDVFKKVFDYHVLSADINSGDLQDGLKLETVEGSKVTFKVTSKGNETTVKVNDATVTTADVSVSNGVVHIVDKVLLPNDLHFPTLPEVAAAANLTTLVKALTTAKLKSVLEVPGPFTLFAPSDAAWAALPNIKALLKNNKGELAKILEYHVVPGEVMSDKLKLGENLNYDGHLKTLEGQDVLIRASLQAKKKNQEHHIHVNNAVVLEADVFAANGVIHVIDHVLLPPAAVQKPPAPAPPLSPIPSPAVPASAVQFTGTAAQSSTFQKYGAAQGSDGDQSTMAHTSGGTFGYGTTNPWWQLDLGKRVAVTSVSLLNRPGSCSSRLFAGRGCAWEFKSDRFGGDSQGADIYVSDVSCGRHGCTGRKCGKIVAPKTGGDHWYSRSFLAGAVGRYVSIVLPGKNRILNFMELEVYGKEATAAEIAAVPVEVLAHRLAIVTMIMDMKRPTPQELQEIMLVPEVEQAMNLQRQNLKTEAKAVLADYKAKLEKLVDASKRAQSQVDPKSAFVI